MTTAILWFRRDLRLTDNPALVAALQHAKKLIPVYIHAPDEESPWSPGAASNWWLHASLTALDRSLMQRGSQLTIVTGNSLNILEKLASDFASSDIYFNNLPESACRHRDEQLSKQLSLAGIDCHRFNLIQLTDGSPLCRSDGGCYRMFTPYYRALIKRGFSKKQSTPAPKTLPPLPSSLETAPLQSLELLPGVEWYKAFEGYWQPGEEGAFKQVKKFLDGSIHSYSEGRDRPDREETSFLSPHLHFGEITPIQIIRGIESRLECDLVNSSERAIEEFLRQLVWREFAYYLLHHFPDCDRHPFDQRFKIYPWRKGKQVKKQLALWQQGRTGIPIVDAAMRQLWKTGWMHNRLRMIVASLLTKNLSIHWLEGARWFWDTLVDADCANNTLGWQWVAGSGVDAAPYFRIFNPVRQGERFDPQGDFIRHWIPELSSLPNRYLYAPWETPTGELLKAGIQLGKSYPKPMVDLQQSRKEALQRWESIKNFSATGDKRK